MRWIKRLHIKPIQNYSLLIVGLFVLVSCTSTTISTETTTVTLTSDQASIPIGTLTKGVALLQSPTSPVGHSTVPPALTPTPLILPSPIVKLDPEPTPTLNSEQTADSFTRLMTENEGCELPCWWGVILGETDIRVIPDLFIPLGFIWWEEWNELDAVTSGSGAIIVFDVEDNIIQSVKIGGRGRDNFVKDWKRYSLDQVLTHYGEPSKVFVYRPWQGDPGPTFFHLLLFYEETGIEIDYVGVSHQLSDGKSQVCPKLSEVIEINLFLFQPEKINNVVELVIPPESVSFVGPSDIVYDLMSWEQAIGTSLQSFYETFKDSDDNNCFDFMIYR